MRENFFGIDLNAITRLPHPYMRAFESREFLAGVALVGGERYRGRAGEAEVGSAGEQPAEE